MSYPTDLNDVQYDIGRFYADTEVDTGNGSLDKCIQCLGRHVRILEYLRDRQYGDKPIPSDMNNFDYQRDYMTILGELGVMLLYTACSMDFSLQDAIIDAFKEEKESEYPALFNDITTPSDWFEPIGPPTGSQTAFSISPSSPEKIHFEAKSSILGDFNKAGIGTMTSRESLFLKSTRDLALECAESRFFITTVTQLYRSDREEPYYTLEIEEREDTGTSFLEGKNITLDGLLSARDAWLFAALLILEAEECYDAMHAG